MSNFELYQYMLRNMRRVQLDNICTNCQRVNYPVLTHDGELELWESVVFSYGVPIARIDINGDIHRLWDGWSLTSQKHLNKAVYGLNMTKQQWLMMEVE